MIQQFWDNETQQMPAMKPDDPSGATIQDVDSTTLLSKSDSILTFSYIYMYLKLMHGSKGIKRNRQDSSEDTKMVKFNVT